MDPKPDPNYKSKIIEWAQKENYQVGFEIISVKHEKHHRELTAQVFINDEPSGKGFGYSKKKPNRMLPKKTCDLFELSIKIRILGRC